MEFWGFYTEFWGFYMEFRRFDTEFWRTPEVQLWDSLGDSTFIPSDPHGNRRNGRDFSKTGWGKLWETKQKEFRVESGGIKVAQLSREAWNELPNGIKAGAVRLE